MKTKIVKRSLPVKLTPKEREEYAVSNSNLIVQVERLNDEKKSVASNYAAKIKTLNAQITKLSQAVSSGQEIRDVECEEHIDRESGFITLARTDTGEIIMRRSVFGEDAQTSMDEFEDEGDIPGAPDPEDETIRRIEDEKKKKNGKSDGDVQN